MILKATCDLKITPLVPTKLSIVFNPNITKALSKKGAMLIASPPQTLELIVISAVPIKICKGDPVVNLGSNSRGGE